MNLKQNWTIEEHASWKHRCWQPRRLHRSSITHFPIKLNFKRPFQERGIKLGVKARIKLRFHQKADKWLAFLGRQLDNKAINCTNLSSTSHHHVTQSIECFHWSISSISSSTSRGTRRGKGDGEGKAHKKELFKALTRCKAAQCLPLSLSDRVFVEPNTLPSLFFGRTSASSIITMVGHAARARLAFNEMPMGDGKCLTQDVVIVENWLLLRRVVPSCTIVRRVVVLHTTSLITIIAGSKARYYGMRSSDIFSRVCVGASKSIGDLSRD